MVSNKKIYSLGIISIVIIIGFIFGLILLINKTLSLSQEYKELKSEIFQIENRISASQEEKKAYQNLQPIFSQIEEMFISSEETVNFIANLEKIAQSTNNTIKILKITSREDKNPYFEFQFSLRGDFSSFSRFLAAIENTPYSPYRLTEIENFSIQRVETTSIPPIIGIPSTTTAGTVGYLKSTLTLKVYKQ